MNKIEGLSFNILDPDPSDSAVFDKGFVIIKIEAILNESVVGYIKIALLSKENFNKVFPTVWHFVRVWKGKWNVELELADNPVAMFELLSGHMDTWPHDYSKTLDDQYKIKKVKQYEELMKDKMIEETKTLMDSPYVDYIFVEPEMRRHGIGLLLYKKAFELMAEKGYTFRSSSLQSKDAFSVWSKLENEGLAEKVGNVFFYKSKKE